MGYNKHMPMYRKFDKDFFKIWNSEMAYVLGFFMADGSMVRNRRGAHFIEFYITDLDLLRKIKKAFRSQHAISSRPRRNGWKTMYRLQIGSKEMFFDLERLGFMQAKSKKMSLPLVPQKFFGNFLRGFFDGDGHVSIGKYRKRGRRTISRVLLAGFTSGSENLLKQILEKLKRLGIVFGGTLYYAQRAYRLCFSINDSLRLYEFMYGQLDTSLFLRRKKKVFENFQKIR